MKLNDAVKTVIAEALTCLALQPQTGCDRHGSHPHLAGGSNVNEQGEITFHGRTAESLLNEFGSPLYVIDTDDVRARAAKFVNPRQMRSTTP